MTPERTWRTVEDNHVDVNGDSFRIVWDDVGGWDIAYVSPVGTNDNGNANARVIAAAPLLLYACASAYRSLVANGPAPEAVLLRALNAAGYVADEVIS